VWEGPRKSSLKSPDISHLEDSANYFPRPAYQGEDVSSYLEKIGDHNKGYYNPSGRGFPDLSAQGLNVHIFNKGVDQETHGTSCSTPMFNGMVALLNSARISSGLPTLGFLNPWIYGAARGAWNDITEGASVGCNGFSKFMGPSNGSPVIPGASWNATEGWYAATGFGTPDIGKLLHLSTP
jgi:tripeptidyl-peptidase-1